MEAERMMRYEQDGAGGRTTAVFPGGERVEVRASRGRGYPALPGPAPDTAAAYRLAAARLADAPGPVADLGAGAGTGTALLRGLGVAAEGVDSAPEAVAFAACHAPGVPFHQGAIEQVDLAGYGALVLIDVLGLVADDAALLRSLARAVAPGTLLVGAVVEASVEQSLEAPCRRAFSPEALDALLVRAGWTAPTLLGRSEGLLVFETRRTAETAVAEALTRAEQLGSEDAATPLLATLAALAERTEAPAEARELSLAMGEILLARGEADAAERAFTGANAIAPSCARPFVALAHVALARGASDDAEALFDHALGLDATNVAAWQGLARLFAERGESPRALESLECAVALAPADADLAAELARLLSHAHDRVGAARVLERLLPFGALSRELQSWYGWLVAAEHTTRSSTRSSTRPISGLHRAAASPRASETRAS
jgi:tetratricopeptide (TPR) repeat protein